MKNFAAAVLILGITSNARAIQWAKGYAPPRATAKSVGAQPPRLLYYGGRVISNVKVYAVFWGDAVSAETKEKIGPFYENVLDSGYIDWLREYDTVGINAVDGRKGTDQRIGRGVYGGAITIRPFNPAKEVTNDMIRRELEEQIAARVLPAPDENTLYMIYYPTEITVALGPYRSCQTTCAYHDGFISKSGAPIYFGNMAACPADSKCRWVKDSAFDSVTISSSHELVEAVTDTIPGVYCIDDPSKCPAYPQAWNTTDGDEIADLCDSPAGRFYSSVTGHGVKSVVVQQWDNAANACNPGPWTQQPAQMPDANALSRQKSVAEKLAPARVLTAAESF
jgi:hypothetical protein